VERPDPQFSENRERQAGNRSPFVDRPNARSVIGNRKSGLLFCTDSGRPLSPSNILSDSLHPILEKLGQPKAGAHAFRRFRTTWLRMQRTPEDLIRFWLGHANKTITDGYSLLKEDSQFRRKIAEQVNIGFEIPASEPDVVIKIAICTQTTSLSTLS
jgi:integrase